MFSKLLLFQKYFGSISFQKKGEMKVIFLGSLMTETTTAADQAVVAVHAGEQGPNSISEAVFHPCLTTMQQHILVDVVSSGREKGKKSRKPRILKSLYLMTKALLYCVNSLYRLKTFTAQYHFSFIKKCSQCNCILHFKVRPGELSSVR